NIVNIADAEPRIFLFRKITELIITNYTVSKCDQLCSIVNLISSSLFNMLHILYMYNRSVIKDWHLKINSVERIFKFEKSTCQKMFHYCLLCFHFCNHSIYS